MEAIIFCGIQASGKTTYYKEHFFKTHVRISLDLLNTRNKEKIFLETCLKLKQRFVIDNTNPTAKERIKYIELAKVYKFRVICYYFNPGIEDVLARNKNRDKKGQVPIPGIRGTLKKLEQPTFEEGFDTIYKVEIIDGKFITIECQKPATEPI